MSLLLDALKKAAQEKQNADAVEASSKAVEEPELRFDANTEQTVSSGGAGSEYADTELELELEAASDIQEQVSVVSSKEENYYRNPESTPALGDQRITPTPSTVTDEALQLLIHKANKAHRRSRLISWGSIITGALIVLTLGGFYFYSNMVQDIESMQRKHQIALATLKSKTRIEENLTSLAKVTVNDTASETDQGNNAKTDTSRNAASASNRKASHDVKGGQTFTVKKAEKSDPVSDGLQRGWTAYQNEDYETSRLEYNQVLKEEPDNHDALLGIAAVSLQQQNQAAARDIYIRLLERDPRDPHAHAGLANIAQHSGSNLSESKLKQLIEYRPDDAHLQFALGNLYVQKRNWPEAQQAFFNAWKTDNSNADYAYNLAVSLDQLGKHREAKVYYQDSLELADGKNISFSPDAVKQRLAYLGAKE